MGPQGFFGVVMNPKHIYAAMKARELLVERFPLAFAPKRAPKRPLKIGIFIDILAAAPDIERWKVSLALKDYCSGPKYLMACTPHAPRIDLTGAPAGTVSEEHAKHATEAWVLIQSYMEGPGKQPTEPPMASAYDESVLTAGDSQKQVRASVTHNTRRLQKNGRNTNGMKRLRSRHRADRPSGADVREP